MAHAQSPIPEDLIESISLSAGGGRGRPRKRASGGIQIIRSLTSEDLPALRDPEQLPAPLEPGGFLHLRHSHHALARCLAEGHPPERASLITGYSPGYIRQLTAVPAFAELLAHYQGEKEAEFVDVAKRMKELGLSSLDELQRRLEESPDDWARGELMALAELMLVKGRVPQGAAAGVGVPGSGGPAVNINVQFVKPGEAHAEGVTIEALPEPMREIEDLSQ